MSATSKPKKSWLVRVTRQRGDSGFYFASSEDLEGFVVSAKSLRELDGLIDEVIVKLYAACGMKVMVTQLDTPSRDHMKEWVAVPAEVAQKALEKSASVI